MNDSEPLPAPEATQRNWPSQTDSDYRVEVGGYRRFVPKTSLPPWPCLTVIVPCYNESATIEALLRRVIASPYVAEVIVVDDASIDGSAEAAQMVIDTRVRVLTQPANRGKGAAIRRGFAEATAQVVIVQDADLEYDPAEYGKVIGPILDGRADVVYGSRFSSSNERRVLYYWHSVGNRLLTTVSNMFTNLNLTDMETCYKAFRREIVQGLDLQEDRFGIEPEITAKVARTGCRVYEVGISYSGRTYAEGKKIGWRDGIRAMFCIFSYSNPGELLGIRRLEPVVRYVTGAKA